PKMSLTAGEALICPALLRIGAIDSLRKLFGRVRTRADRRTHGRRHACVERKRAGGTPALRGPRSCGEVRVTPPDFVTLVTATHPRPGKRLSHSGLTSRCDRDFVQ